MPHAEGDRIGIEQAIFRDFLGISVGIDERGRQREHLNGKRGVPIEFVPGVNDAIGCAALLGHAPELRVARALPANLITVVEEGANLPVIEQLTRTAVMVGMRMGDRNPGDFLAATSGKEQRDGVKAVGVIGVGLLQNTDGIDEVSFPGRRL